MFKLVIEDDEGNKTVVPIIRDEITIGRQDGNTIRLTERNVSRKHARLVRDNGAVFLEEIEARYGTRKNGERIDGRTEFSIGDVFTIGDYRLTLQTEAASEAKPPPKPNGATAPPKGGSEFSNQPTQITRVDDAEDKGPSEGTEILPKDPAKLVIVSSNFAGQEFPLARKEMVIGRGEECDIIIDHRSVSQKHAKVVREQGGDYKIVDLKSKNGVKVSGEEYRAVHLKRGDIVELGHVKFRFVEPGENYVFTPQAEVEAEFTPKSNKGPLLAVGLVFLIAASAIAYFATRGTEATSTKTSTPSPSSEKLATPTPTPPPEEDEPTSNEAEKIITQAEKAYAEGRIPDTLARLDAARLLDITPEQDDRIAELRSRAAREKAPAEKLRTGRRDLQRERWIDALDAFTQIPPEPKTRVYEAMVQGKLKEKAIDGAIAEAKKLADDEEIDEANELLDELATYVSDEDEAKVAGARKYVKDAKPKPVAIKRPRPRVDRDPPREEKPERDPAKGEALVAEATQAFVSGRNEETIRKCREASKHGSFPKCVRLTAMAYHKSGDKQNACKWAAKTSNAQKMLSRFGCE